MCTLLWCYSYGSWYIPVVVASLGHVLRLLGECCLATSEWNVPVEMTITIYDWYSASSSTLECHCVSATHTSIGAFTRTTLGGRYCCCSRAQCTCGKHESNMLTSSAVLQCTCTKQSEMIPLEYIPVVMSSLSSVLCLMEDDCSTSNDLSEQAMRVTVWDAYTE